MRVENMGIAGVTPWYANCTGLGRTKLIVEKSVQVASWTYDQEPS